MSIQAPRFGELRITLEEHRTRYYKGYTALTLFPENAGTVTYNGRPVNLDDKPGAIETLKSLEQALSAKPADKEAFDAEARKGIRKILDAATAGLPTLHKPSFAHPRPKMAYYKDRLTHVIDSGESVHTSPILPSYRLFVKA